MTSMTELHSLYGAITRWCFYCGAFSVLLLGMELLCLWYPVLSLTLLQGVDILLIAGGSVTLTLFIVQRKLDRILFRRMPHD